MLTVRLSKELEERLDRLASRTHRSKSYYVKIALEKYLDEQEEWHRQVVEFVCPKDVDIFTLDILRA